MSTRLSYPLPVPTSAYYPKTTFFHYMLEEKKNYTGEILLDGQEIHEDHKRALNEIGYVSEDNSFFEEHTAIENARLLPVGRKDIRKVRREYLFQFSVKIGIAALLSQLFGAVLAGKVSLWNVLYPVAVWLFVLGMGNLDIFFGTK